MSYAVRTDGKGWRSVSGPEDCGQDETWQQDQPPVVVVEAATADPVQKLQAFLSENPDVAALLR